MDYYLLGRYKHHPPTALSYAYMCAYRAYISFSIGENNISYTSLVQKIKELFIFRI